MAGLRWAVLLGLLAASAPLVGLAMIIPPSDDVLLHPATVYGRGSDTQEAWSSETPSECPAGEHGWTMWGLYLEARDAGSTCVTFQSVLVVPRATEQISFGFFGTLTRSGAGVSSATLGGLDVWALATLRTGNANIESTMIYQQNDRIGGTFQLAYLNASLPATSDQLVVQIDMAMAVPPDPLWEGTPYRLEIRLEYVSLGPALLQWDNAATTDAATSQTLAGPVLAPPTPRTAPLRITVQPPDPSPSGWAFDWIIELEHTSERRIEAIEAPNGAALSSFEWLALAPENDATGERIRIPSGTLQRGGQGDYVVHLGAAVQPDVAAPAFIALLMGALLASPVAALASGNTTWRSEGARIAMRIGVAPTSMTVFAVAAIVTVLLVGDLRLRSFPLDGGALIWWGAIVASYLAPLVYWSATQVRHRRELHAEAAVVTREKEEHGARAERFEQMLHSVTHDLKTPMLTMEWLVDHIRETEGLAASEALLETSARLSDNVSQMKAFVEDMTMLARLESNEEKPATKEAVPLAPRLAAAVERLTVLADKAGIQIEQNADERVQLPGPRVLVDQVLNNLIGNAIKYGKQGNGHIRVTASREANSTTVRIVVEDDGPGIPERERERVRALFVRGSPDRHPAVPGTGVGLAIVDRIVSKWGGSLQIASSELGGAAFVITVPFDARPAT